MSGENKFMQLSTEDSDDLADLNEFLAQLLAEDSDSDDDDLAQLLADGGDLWTEDDEFLMQLMNSESIGDDWMNDQRFMQIMASEDPMT